MVTSNETILRKNAMDGERAIDGFFAIITGIVLIIVAIYSYFTGGTMNYWSLTITTESVSIGVNSYSKPLFVILNFE